MPHYFCLGGLGKARHLNELVALLTPLAASVNEITHLNGIYTKQGSRADFVQFNDYMEPLRGIEPRTY